MAIDSDHVALSQKLYYGLGNLGQGILSGLYSAAIMKYIVDVVQLSAARVTLAFAIYAIWNAINDPIFGYLSDRVQWKRGFRTPWLKLANPFLALFFCLFWFTPEGDSWWGFCYLFLMLIGYDTFFTIIGLNIAAILPSMTQNTVERSRIQLISAVFAVIAALASLAVPSFLLTGTINLGLFRGVLIICAIISFLISQLCAIKVIERFPGVKDPTMGILESMKLALKNKSFMALVLCNFSMIFFTATATNALLYLTEYVLGLTGMEIIVPGIFMGLGVAAGAYICQHLVKTRGLKVAMFRGVLITGIGLTLLPFLPGPLIYLALITVGFGIVTPGLLFNVIIGDLADEDELKTHTRREGIFFGVNALITKPAQSLAASFIAFMLVWFHYQPPLEISEGLFVSQPQTAMTIWGIKIMFGLIPGILVIIGSLLFRFYDLEGEKIKKIKAQVALLHPTPQ